MSKWENNEEVNILREYLRIPSVQPDVDYEPCVTFLKKQAENLGLPISIHYPANPKKPVVIITWTGLEPDLPSIVLNSHMDVVPVFEKFWTHPPFAADMDSDGKIYARGTQDTKGIAIEYLGAIRAFLKENVRLKRTVHVMFAPDEEIGSEDGMMKFVRTPEFQALNIGFLFDEGSAVPDDVYLVYYAEKSIWRVYFKCSGTTGHGSILHKNTAGEKVRYIIDKFMDFRAGEVAKMESNPDFNYGDVTTVNLNIINGGVLINVLPSLITIGFDVRLALDVNHAEFEQMLNQWCEEAGGDIEIFFESKYPYVKPTKIDDTNPFWLAFKHAMVNELNLKIKPIVGYARGDTWFFREVGIPCFGFAPTKYTPRLMHDHNEYIGADTFLEGIEIYKTILLNVANV